MAEEEKKPAAGKERRGEKDPGYEKRKEESEAAAIEIDVHEEKAPETIIHVREDS
ncbi:MAG: hypothetical protein KDK37_13095 [Leptospiraceae bacterium]|nr:hypothetical protein [Leptospiraceae bacterium]MCB1305216.1 hypothetical protein [Leptospiraceae bacterium]